MPYNIFSVTPLAVIALTLLVGCASKSKALDPDELQANMAESQAEFRELIAREIDDPARAKLFAALADERDSLVSRHSAYVQSYSRSLKKLNSDYSATREDFDNLIETYNTERRSSQAEFLDLIGRMKAATTEKEWKKLAKFELKKLNPPAMTYSVGEI